MGKKPLCVSETLPCVNPETNAVASPDTRYILTGTSGARTGVLSGSAEEEKEEEARRSGAAGGQLVLLDSATLRTVRKWGASGLTKRHPAY